jgi:hypothetical protein
MKLSHYSILFAVTITLVVPCVAQEQNSQPDATVTGSGKAHYVPLWKSSTALTNSVIYATGGEVGIGTTTPGATLEVNGNAQIDGNFTLSGSILETGVGQLLWAPNDGSGNFSVGLEALPSSTSSGQDNTAIGYRALAVNTSGAGNTANGSFALAANTVGFSNTASGQSVLEANTSGNSNTALGVSAMASNTTGSGNTAIGVAALTANTVGYSNVATGNFALFSNTSGSTNTASGTQALAANTTGSSNLADGAGALYRSTSGSNNTAVGEQTLYSSTIGSYNIALGYQSGYSITNTNNNIDIGNYGTTTDSGTIRIGCSNDCNGIIQTSAFIAGISNSNISGVPVIVNSSGQLGVASSSRRYKEEIQDMGDASDGLMRLRPVTFRYKKAYEDGSKPIQYGLIAEEVAEIYPDLVAKSADGQVESVRYQLLDPMLLNELQKQHATIDAQKKQIESLEERLARAEAMLTAGATGATGQ